MKTLVKSCLLLILIGLAGCAERPTNVYLFGLAKSCFTKSEGSKCPTLKIYDRVQIKVYGEKQEVIYLREALKLDESNTIYKKLNNCKVIDRDNFACEELARTNGDFTETKAFDDLAISTSYLTYAYSWYLDSNISRRYVRFFHDNDAWLPGVLIVFGIFMLLGILGGT